ncbi:MAG: oligosaccharide flippase family protein [Pyrinomonadaceae bacterium]|nr:oligosaccharide flippase family protein [Pyrinomonadaceae bacterium]
MEETSIKTSSLKMQSVWLLFAKVVGFGFSFLLPLLIVRYLSQEQVGVYRQVFLVIINANIILMLGFGMSAYYFLARETVRRPAVIINTLLFNFTVGGIACLTLYFYPQLIGNIFHSAEITRLAPKIGVVIWLWIFSSYLEIVPVANREPRAATAFIILAQMTKTALMISAVIIFTTVEAFVYAAMAQAAIQTIVLLVYLNSRFPKFWTAFDASFFREQLFYALPFGLASLLWTLQTDIHNYFVGYQFGSAEFAIYAIGCFELPLIAMLAESVTSVLIPRMSELQSRGDKPGIIRLTARIMQKLAFFYFPIYIFLMITAQTFITTLFTRDYLASVPVFLINITLLPMYILVTDPIVRAYKELGRLLLTLRVLIIVALIPALYFGIQNFDLRGMIAIVVVTAFVDRLVSTAIVLKKLNAGRRDLFLLKNIGKIAAASLLAGFFTYLFYWGLSEQIFWWGEHLPPMIFSAPRTSIVDFIAGNLVLGSCALVFAPIYLFAVNFFGVIENDEKEKIKSFIRRLLPFVKKVTIQNPKSEVQN